MKSVSNVWVWGTVGTVGKWRSNGSVGIRFEKWCLVMASVAGGVSWSNVAGGQESCLGVSQRHEGGQEESHKLIHGRVD